MGRPSWIEQANGGASDEPPRSGRGATTEAWRKFAEARGHRVPKSMGRDQIIELVDAGPPAPPAIPAAGMVEGPIYTDTLRAIKAATDDGTLTEADVGAVAVLLDLAKKIDGMVQRGATNDNVTVPIYLKFSDALGLTPAARARLPKKGNDSGSKLTKLRSSPQLTALRGGQAS